MIIKEAFIYKKIFNNQNKGVKKLANEPKETHVFLLKRGLKENLPKLVESELAFTTDENRLYVGSKNGNIALPQLSETEAKYTKPADGIPISDLNVNLQEKVNKGDVAESNAKNYIDKKIDDLVDGASSQLDTLKEIGDAIQNGDSAHSALVNEVATKAKQEDFDAHLNDKNNPHGVTKDQLGLDKVDNTTDLEKPISEATQDAINSVSSEIQDVEYKLENHKIDMVSHLSWEEHNKLTAIEDNANNFTLKIADETILGGIKKGKNVEIDENGVLNIEDASETSKGLVKLSSSTQNDDMNVAASAKAVKIVDDKITILNNNVTTAMDEAHLARTNSEDALGSVSNLDQEFRNLEDNFYELTSGNTDQEVIDSRGSYPKLNKRLEALDTAIQNIDVTDQITDKVDKVEGKQLSTNDYTNEEKTKLADVNVEVTEARGQKATLNERLEELDNSIKNIDLTSAVDEAKAYTDNAIDNLTFTHISGGSF